MELAQVYGFDPKNIYTYDNYGNRTSVTTNAVLVNEPTSTATNRLTGGSYDSAGNLTWWNGNVYEYDDFNMLKRSVSGSEEWLHMYTANDERFTAYAASITPARPTAAGTPRPPRSSDTPRPTAPRPPFPGS